MSIPIESISQVSDQANIIPRSALVILTQKRYVSRHVPGNLRGIKIKGPAIY